MTSTGQDLTRYIGDKTTFSLTITDSAGDPLNMTGYSAAWVAYDGNGTAVITKTTGDGISIGDGDGTNDKLTITLNPADTADLSAGIYGHQAEVTDGSSNPVTVAEGALTLKADYA